MMAGAAAATLTPGLCWSENGKVALRLAISDQTLAGANVSDARAAYRVWLGEVRGALGVVTAEPVPDIFIPSEELIRNVRKGTLDCYGITGLEFVKVADLTDPDSLVLQDYMADGIEYVLLVHNRSSFKKIADLRGAHILSHLHRDMVLLSAWLGTMLAANSLPQAEQFFASHQLIGSLNQVVLPVFFRRMDGACMARRSWETAAELNPQLGRDLRAIAVSPKIVPIVFAFRSNTNASARKALIDSIQHIYSVPAGQQIIALYQSHGFVLKPISAMKSTTEMVHQFERLPAPRAGSRKGPA
jgi:phosphonate transport system substrate-binding protein